MIRAETHDEEIESRRSNSMQVDASMTIGGSFTTTTEQLQEFHSGLSSVEEDEEQSRERIIQYARRLGQSQPLIEPFDSWGATDVQNALSKKKKKISVNQLNKLCIQYENNHPRKTNSTKKTTSNNEGRVREGVRPQQEGQGRHPTPTIGNLHEAMQNEIRRWHTTNSDS